MSISVSYLYVMYTHTTTHLDSRYENLFLLLAELECAATSQIARLFFSEGFAPSRDWDPSNRGIAPKRDGIAYQSVRARLAVLHQRGLIDRMRFGLRGRGMAVWHLTEQARTLFSSVEKVATQTVSPSKAEAQRGWQRADLRMRLQSTKVSCGQDQTARRRLAEHCGQNIELSGPLPFDIVLGVTSNGNKVAQLVVVDDTRLNPEALVEKLPLHNSAGVQVGVMFRPSDDSSTWSKEQSSWAKGRRHREIKLLLKECPQYKSWEPKKLAECGVLRFSGPSAKVV